MRDYSFVNGLTTLHLFVNKRNRGLHLASRIGLSNLITILKEEYLFKVENLREDSAHHLLIVSFQEGCSEIQKEWIMDILDYYKPIGILIVEESYE